MFPMDQPALLNQMAREMHGHVVTETLGAECGRNLQVSDP